MENTTQIPAETGTTRLPSDAAEVAARVGVSSSLVRKVINGSRTNERVLKAYHLLLNERSRAQQKFQPAKKGK